MPRGLPRTFYALVAMEFLVQPILLLAMGQSVNPRAAGLALLALLVYGIARRSSLAWALVFAYTLMLSVAVLLLATPNMSWLALTAYNGATLCLLLSPSLRSHVRGMTRGRIPQAAA